MSVLPHWRRPTCVKHVPWLLADIERRKILKEEYRPLRWDAIARSYNLLQRPLTTMEEVSVQRSWSLWRPVCWQLSRKESSGGMVRSSGIAKTILQGTVSGGTKELEVPSKDEEKGRQTVTDLRFGEGGGFWVRVSAWQRHALLGGSGACSPGECLKYRCVFLHSTF